MTNSAARPRLSSQSTRSAAMRAPSARLLT